MLHETGGKGASGRDTMFVKRVLFLISAVFLEGGGVVFVVASPQTLQSIVAKRPWRGLSAAAKVATTPPPRREERGSMV